MCLLIETVVSKTEVIFSNQLCAISISLSYNLFLTNMPEIFYSHVHNKVLVLIESLHKLCCSLHVDYI